VGPGWDYSFGVSSAREGSGVWNGTGWLD